MKVIRTVLVLAALGGALLGCQSAPSTVDLAQSAAGPAPAGTPARRTHRAHRAAGPPGPAGRIHRGGFAGRDPEQRVRPAPATIRLQDGRGRRYALPTGRTVRYVLVRNTGPAAAARPFLIDSWTVAVTVSRPRRTADTP